MKKTTIQIETDAEKAKAIRLYLDGKDGSLEGELTEYVDTLYKKYVPAPVREFIEKTEQHDGKTERKSNRKVAQNKPFCGDVSTVGVNTRENN